MLCINLEISCISPKKEVAFVVENESYLDIIHKMVLKFKDMALPVRFKQTHFFEEIQETVFVLLQDLMVLIIEPLPQIY